MELEHSFTVPVPIDRAWDVLLDVERVAPCMPGATVTSVDGDEVHATVKVKVGPISMAYAGTARFVEKDKATWTVLLEASGKETRGAGTAAAKIRSVLTEAGDETHVTVMTTLNVTGRPAQFGRGVMSDVSGKLLTIFATNLAALLTGPDAAAEPATASAADDSGPIDELQLPARVASSLSREGLVTVGQLAARTPEELLAIDGIGPASIEDIKIKLTERGLALGQAPASAAATTVGSPNGEHSPAASTGAGAGAAAPSPLATAPVATAPVATAPGPVATPATGPSGTGSDRPASVAQDHEALNLIKIAGLPLLKRALPALAGLLAVGLIAIRVRLRRRRSRD
jgi:carbon monoxide dehydrogenase subunit G